MKPAPFEHLAPADVAEAPALRPFKAELNATPVRWEDVAAIIDDDPFA